MSPQGFGFGIQSEGSWPLPESSMPSASWRRSIQHARGDYNVGWVCVLPVELAAAEAMLDETHAPMGTPADDMNTYVLGRIGFHNVVIACPGTVSGPHQPTFAAQVACRMKSSFPAVRFSLLVGVGGGVPFNGPDVRLGDVVVGYPAGDSGGIIQYTASSSTSGSGVRLGSSNRPPFVLLTAIAKLRAQHLQSGTQIANMLVDRFLRHEAASRFLHPGRKHDRLFAHDFHHDQRSDTCGYCLGGPEIRRPSRPNDEPVVHYGVIASGNHVIRDALTRDRVAKRRAIICFENDAAGLASDFPCLVIRGIRHYSDSHKTTLWEPFAAATAACFARQLLCSMQRHEETRRSRLQRYQSVLSSLAFEGAQPRSENTALMDNNACQWFSTHPTYLSWTDPRRILHHLGFLWIEGVAGSGKSTLMDSVREHVGATMTDAVIISYVFDTRPGRLELSTPAFYRALLLQILQAAPVALHVLDAFDTQLEPDVLWDRPLLQAMLGRAIGRLQHRCLFCFVDTDAGLGENDIREVVSFFQDLGNVAVLGNVQLRVYFSSRPFPCITIRSGHRLRLEAQRGHNRAIEKFIRANLTIKKGILADGIREWVRVKSAGVFAWVILAVDILGKEHAKGGIFALRDRLEQLPDRLEDLWDVFDRHDTHVRGHTLVRVCSEVCLLTDRMDSGRNMPPQPLEKVQTVLTRPPVDTCREPTPAGRCQRRSRLSRDSTRPRPGHLRSPIMIPSSLLEGQFPLLLALALDDEEAALRLVEKADTDIRSPDELGRTPLAWAATQGFFGVADLILDRLDDEDVVAVDMYRRNPLSHAAQSGHIRLVQRLLANPAVDPDVRDSYGRSPLSWAAAGGFTHVVSLLLDTGRVDPDGMDQYGRTPLSWAAQEGHMDVVETLLATGLVHANKKDTMGWTASAWARMGGHDKVAARLQRLSKICRRRLTSGSLRRGANCC